MTTIPRTVTLADARDRLPDLIGRLGMGLPVYITDGGRCVGVLTPPPPDPSPAAVAAAAAAEAAEAARIARAEAFCRELEEMRRANPPPEGETLQEFLDSLRTDE